MSWIKAMAAPWKQRRGHQSPNRRAPGLQQAQLDDPYNGRFRFGTDGIRRGVDPLDVASGRTDALERYS